MRHPGYRLHKPSGQAFIELNGKRHYLGKHGSAESKSKYDAMLADWLSNGRTAVAQPVTALPQSSITVAQLIARFDDHAKVYYATGNEAHNYKQVGNIAKRLYGSLPVDHFTPKHFKQCREEMIELNWVRSNINRQTNRLRHIFKWGVSEAIVNPQTWQALQAVPGLKRGKTQATESKRIQPVPIERVDAIQNHVPKAVWALIQLQLLTAARCGELLTLRATDIDMSGKVWTYKPDRHKTAHCGHERVIHFGPKAQAVLRPFLKRKAQAFLFSPKDNVKDRPRGKPGNHYTSTSYAHAIERGCLDAKVEKWHSHQLRHTAATLIRRDYGIEAARIILGHADPAITLIYAEADQSRAMEVMARIG